MAIINGTFWEDVLVGGPEDDVINGLPGNDVITGGDGNDTVNYEVPLGGLDKTDLGSGFDTVNIFANTPPIKFVQFQTRLALETDGVGNGSPLAGSTLTNPNGDFAVTIERTSSSYLSGYTDYNFTGNGARFDDEGITFQSGNGLFVQERGSDINYGAGFISVILGTSGDDTLIAAQNEQPQYINGGMGNDNITGGLGNDYIVGGFGNDNLYGSDGVDFIDGGVGNDTLSGGLGNDTILGGAGDDVAILKVSTDDADSVNLGDGSDLVNVTAAAGQVRLSFTSAEVGNGTVNDAGALASQDGGLAVRLQAEGADDTLAGAVSRFDDEGITFSAAPGTTFDVRDLVSGVQRGDAFGVVTLGTSGSDTLATIQDARPYYINGGKGNDVISGGSANDFLVGSAGNDTIFGGAGDDTAAFNVSTDGADNVNLGDGSDLVNVAAASAGQVRLSFTSAEVGNGNVNDAGTLPNQDGGLAVRLQGEGAGDTLNGSISRFDDEGITFAAAPGTTFDVRDLVSGVQRGDGFEFVTLGTSGNDTLAATQDARPYYINGGMGPDVISGGSANDFLVGGAGNDALSGGAGNDTFIGGGGNDLLDGGAGIDRAIFTYTLGSATLGRSADGYVTITGAEGTDTLRGIEQFQFSDRTVDVADGSPLVDDLYYLNRYGDVAAAGQDADTHYAAYGAAEGRDPNAFFSTSGYRAANQDVVQTGTDALSQYRDAGFKQGRDPGASFDNQFYLARNPDVAVAGLNPLQHYLEYGQLEGRSINEAIGRTADLKGGAFDAEFYLLSYSDVAVEAAKTGDSFAYARNHFEQYGWKEGRDPNAVFETQAYLNAYADVAGANINPLTHYDQYGWKEGRDPSVGFDTTNYLKAFGDVTLVGLNPMQHFLQYGLYEGRSNFADGTFGAGLIG